MGKVAYPAPTEPYGRRNIIRNGDFAIWQRGVQLGLAGFSTGYSADGWRFEVSSSDSASYHARATSNPGLEGFRACLVNCSGQTGASHYIVVEAVIEGVHKLQGEVVTLSFDCAVDTGTASVGVEIEQIFGTGGSPSATVQTPMGAVPVTTTLGRKYLTFTMPSIAGKTRGTNLDDYVKVNLWFSAGTSYAARASNIGLRNGTFSLTHVQLEKGRVATPFEFLPEALQLTWCQRYYERYTCTNPTSNVLSFIGQATSGTDAQVIWPFKVTKRVIPTWGSSAVAGWFLLMTGGGGQGCTALSALANGTTEDHVVMSATMSASAMIAGGATILGGGTGAWLEASAEL